MLPAAIAAALVTCAASCGDGEGAAWGQASGLFNGEPWEGRASANREDDCPEYELTLEGSAPGTGYELNVRLFVASFDVGVQPVADVRTVDGHTQVRCLRRDDTTLARILTGGSDFISDEYAVTPITGAERVLIVDEVTDRPGHLAGSLTLSARLWADGEPPEASPGRPDTLLLRDVAFRAPLAE